MSREDLLGRLASFVGRLQAEDLRDTSFLEELQALGSSLRTDDVSALGDPSFSFEASALEPGPPPAAPQLRHLETLVGELRKPSQPKFRVFRREVPLAESPLPGSQPDWANGVRPVRTIGPIRGVDGRRFWFDFFPIVRLVALHLPGEQQPALLFYVSTKSPLGELTPLPLSEVLPLFKGSSYKLGRSSLWVRADLLAKNAPAGGYVGLTVESGTIQTSQAPVDVLGKLTLPAGATCSVSLALAQPDAPQAGGTRAAQDVQDAKLSLPAELGFRFSTQVREVKTVGRSRWHLYGQELAFEWDAKKSPTFDTNLNGVRIPLRTAESKISVRASESAFAQARGEAAVAAAGWLLPVSTIDVAQPTAATGIGGLAVQGNSDLTLSWRGLRDGPVDLPQPWIVLFPGLLVIVEPAAGNLYAHQRFQLWKDEDSTHRSSVEVRYTDSFPLFYAAGIQGIEVLRVVANGEARLDRPVDVGGNALDIRSKDSLLLFSFTDAEQWVLLYDDNILADNLNPNLPLPPQFPEPIGLALRNALFTSTPVNGFLLFAELLDDEVVDVGNVLLVFGLYGLLPTLPDPYAANVSTFRKQTARGRHGGSVSMLLLSHVGWRKAAGDAPDGVDTNFLLLPFQSKNNVLLADVASGGPATPATPAPTHSTAAFGDLAGTHARELLEPEWDRRFRSFYREQFALLDVSTNADWMGVSLGWFDPERVTDNDHIFFKVYGAGKSGESTQDLFPLQVRSLDLTAEGRFVRAFTVPQISWEPLFNLTPGLPSDPPQGVNFYPNDGGPTRLFNDNTERVPIAPLPKVAELLRYFADTPGGFTGALFTLPFGLKAFAEINRDHAYLPDAKLDTNQMSFRQGELKGGLQLRTDAPERTTESPMFIGGTLQLNNIVHPNGAPTGTSTLGSSVSEIFNNEFFVLTGGYGDRGVPLTRIDFSGYGSSTFSAWENPEAAFAETSQSRFDVFLGRTAHEVIQVKSVVYPWGIRVVRTIVVFRSGSSYVYRYDTGWQAETPGLYDFSYRVKETPISQPVARPNPFEIHPGIVNGVHAVRNITETPDIPLFVRTWNRVNGDTYIDDAGVEQVVDGSTPAQFKNSSVKLQPVYFDADADIDFVESGAVEGRVPSKRMLGYVQLGPKGQPIPDFLFRDLLREQFGSLGGPVDCQINVGESGQKMRLSRIEVSESVDAAGTTPVFVGTTRGSLVLPKDGSWSVTQYTHGSGEVAPLPENATVPLIRKGSLTSPPGAGDRLRIENPMEVVRAAESSSIFYGLLQSTGTQKALFRKPRFKQGLDELESETPDFSDAYRMLNSAAVFPNLGDTIPLDLGGFKTKIISDGMKLMDELDPDKVLEKALPDGPWYVVDEDFLKIYIEYDKRDKNGVKTSDGSIQFGFDSAAQDLGKRWLSKLNEIGMVVDLGPLERMMMVKGKFDAEKGAAPAFQGPELEFSDELQPVIDILQILLMLQGGDYAEALAKGLEIAMSNSAESWEYSFHARKEIPVLRFPPPALDSPTAPLKLEAGLSVGMYFNEVFSPSGGAESLIPTAGAYLGFYGRLSVMCVSVAAATIYATGSVDLQLAADTKLGPSLKMAFGFGAEINVGLPVIGNVSILFMVGVEIYLDSTKVVTAAFLLFRGRAEILGGIVTVTIFIEAKGIVERLTAADETNMIAQVTFGLDISIFWVINISFTESWQESRQIA